MQESPDRYSGRAIYTRILNDRDELESHLGPFNDLKRNEYLQYIDGVDDIDEVREGLKHLVSLRVDLFERMAELADSLLQKLEGR